MKKNTDTISDINERFNTKEGLELVCKTLEGMRLLAMTRRHLKEHVTLREFLVGKTWYLDMQGGISRLEPGFNIDKELGRVPEGNIIDLGAAAIQQGWGSFQERFNSSIHQYRYGNKLPFVGSVCPLCGQGWSIEDGYDALRKSVTSEVSLERYAKKSMKEAKHKIENGSDAKKAVRVISNIDDLEYLEGDETAMMTITKHYHSSCLMRRPFPRTTEDLTHNIGREEIMRLMEEAGYGIRSVNKPLMAIGEEYLVDTKEALFLVGSRANSLRIIIQEPRGADLAPFGIDEFITDEDSPKKMLMELTITEAIRDLQAIRECLKATKNERRKP